MPLLWDRLPLGQVVCGKAEEVLKGFPSESVDLAVSSPPYDQLRAYEGYTLDLLDIGVQLFRVVKQGGVAVLVMQDQTKNYAKSLTTFRTAVQWCDVVGFRLFECLVARKHGHDGAWWRTRFRVDHEYMLVFLKGAKPAYFNKTPLKVPTRHSGQKTRYNMAPWHGRRPDTQTKEVSAKKCRGTVWEYLSAGDGSKLKHTHPATFSDKVPVDFIQCFCPPQGVVLDPMCGSGTTLMAAKALERKWVGVDISESYCKLSRKRIAEEDCRKML